MGLTITDALIWTGTVKALLATAAALEVAAPNGWARGRVPTGD